jgi:hypothetical protein
MLVPVSPWRTRPEYSCDTCTGRATVLVHITESEVALAPKIDVGIIYGRLAPVGAALSCDTHCSEWVYRLVASLGKDPRPGDEDGPGVEVHQLRCSWRRFLLDLCFIPLVNVRLRWSATTARRRVRTAEDPK